MESVHTWGTGMQTNAAARSLVVTLDAGDLCWQPLLIWAAACYHFICTSAVRNPQLHSSLSAVLFVLVERTVVKSLVLLHRCCYLPAGRPLTIQVRRSGQGERGLLFISKVDCNELPTCGTGCRTQSRTGAMRDHRPGRLGC